MTPEKRVQNQLMEYLNTLAKQTGRVFVDRRQAGGFSYKKGLPDIYFVVNGVHVELEVKAPNGSLSTMQEKWRDRFIDMGIIWLCCSSLQQLKEFIKMSFNLEVSK